jgi:TPP-dependent pyruvate/acetoin dehydrogenase alpha subunit
MQPKAMSKLYFDQQLDFCYPMKHIKAYMQEAGIEQMKVTRAEKSHNKDDFFCSEFREFGSKSLGGCGKICEGYQPRNGKRGMCKHQRPTYEPSNETLIVRV